MNKAITTSLIIGATILCLSCSGKGPREEGLKAGKAACECYKLEGHEAVEACLNQVENEYKEFMSDTAFVNAMEETTIQCVSDGVIDIVKPIKEVSKAPEVKKEAENDTNVKSDQSNNTEKK